MAASPQFAASPLAAAVNISTANAARDGTGTIGILVTAPATGLRVDDIAIKARQTTTAGMIRFFLHDGTNFFLIREVLVTAVTASGTVAAFETFLSNLGWCLQSGWSIRVATDKAEGFNIAVTRGGPF